MKAGRRGPGGSGVTQDSGPAPSQAQVTLTTQSGVGEIRYTTDGAAPTAASPLYAGGLVLPLPTRLKTAAFKDGKAISAISDETLDAASVRHHTSQQLHLCSFKLALNLEDDGPIDGPRASFLIDILDPCWIYPKADLTGISGLSVSVGQVPFNFQIGADRDKIVLHPPRTPDGELEVRLDSCTGELVASLPLAPAVSNTGVTTLTGDLPPRPGRHDLCFTFTSKTLDPMWAIDWVQLTPPPPSPEPKPVSDLTLVSPMQDGRPRWTKRPTRCSPSACWATVGPSIRPDRVCMRPAPARSSASTTPATPSPCAPETAWRS